MLLQAADVVFEIPAFTASQFFAGLLLLALSAAGKAVVRALDESSAGTDDPQGNRRAAARLGQYLGLIAGTVVLLTPRPTLLGTSVALAGVFLLYLTLILLGRLLAVWAPQALLRAASMPLTAWSLLMAPLLSVANIVEKWTMKRRGRDETLDTGERLLALLASSGLEGDELAIFGNAVRFRERNVGELMVPRPDVVWLSINENPARIVQQVRESGHSRFPLCLDSPDQVVGYLHARDLGLLSRVPSLKDLRGLARVVSFVPETADAMALLRRFQRERSHMAVVVDEFGGTAGIVTLEDLIEELVGEIRDEFDEEEFEITTFENGEILIDGAVRLDDLERDYGLSFGDVEEETLGGFVFGRLAREVKAGDELELEEALLRVEGVEGLRVTRVRLIPAAAPQPV